MNTDYASTNEATETQRPQSGMTQVSVHTKNNVSYKNIRNQFGLTETNISSTHLLSKTQSCKNTKFDMDKTKYTATSEFKQLNTANLAMKVIKDLNRNAG